LEQTLKIAEQIQEEDKEILEALAKDTESEGYLESKDMPKEEQVFKDEKGEEYTVDDTGKRNYVINKMQWTLNKKERAAAKKEKKQLVEKIVAEMRSTGSWPGTSYMEGEGVVKKKIEQIFADDASLELKELMARADDSVLQEVYNEILKDTNK
jgi:hypothetical protein